MPQPDDPRLDAYLAGDLSPSEQRALAQQALDDPELFSLLASAAVVQTTASDMPVAARRRRSLVVWTSFGAIAAAAIVVFMVSVDRSSTSRAPSSSAASKGPSEPAIETPPAVAARVALHPVILTGRLGNLSGEPSPEFRSAPADSRAPKETGAVASVEDGEVTIDLGSLDGLTKGLELLLVRQGSNATVRMTVATVFRERSRGRITRSELVQAGDRVDVPPPAQLMALLEHALSARASGKGDAVRAVATRAVSASASVTSAEGAATMNDLAALLIDGRDYANAETLLRQAQMHADGITAVRVANNLAALAALRGDIDAAEPLYRSALALTTGSTPAFEAARRSIEKNIQELRPGP